MLKLLSAIFVSYLIGSIPTAYLFAKYIKGIDIRKQGSGNVGATNVYRVIGKVPGFIVLALDIVKGMLPVLLLPYLFALDAASIAPITYKTLVGVAAIAGHIWTIFLNWKGGKGVATAAGVLIILTPKVVGVAFLVWVVVFAMSRYVSLSSIAAAATLPVMAFVLGEPLVVKIFVCALCVIGILTHRTNILRLLSKSEHKL